MNILQSLISNSLLLAPCIVRTFKKSLTAVDIIKFTEEDEKKYLIIEHSSGNYFGFNLHESNERTSAISIVQDKEEFMVIGWKVAKVIPTRVLCFVDWNNLMTSHNATLRHNSGNRDWPVLINKAVVTFYYKFYLKISFPM